MESKFNPLTFQQSKDIMKNNEFIKSCDYHFPMQSKKPQDYLKGFQKLKLNI